MRQQGQGRIRNNMGQHLNGEESAPKALIDEILQKIGRNLLLNQEVEHTLKTILSYARIEGTFEDAPHRLATRRARLARSSMGELQRLFRIELLAQENDESTQHPSELSQTWIRTTIRLELSESEKKLLESDLDALVSGRNELAHHFLPRWRPSSRSAMEQVSAQLDVQRDKTIDMRQRLRSMHETSVQALKTASEFWQSEHGEMAMERAFLQGSQMIALLSQIATTHRRADGWADLSYVASIAQRSEPETFADRKARYGKQSLKALVIDSGLFEVKEEALPRGVRTLIRGFSKANT